MKFRTTIFSQLFAMLILLMGITSCQTYKEVAYFQNAEEVEKYPTAGPISTLHIMPKDVLNFTVAQTTSPEVATIYNLTSTQPLRPDGSMQMGGGGLKDYEVSNDGYINFPKLGKLYVLGKTLDEVERDLAHAIAADFNEQPVITARLKEYKVTITGETQARGVVRVTAQRYITILEALAMQRDLTIYGKRDNIIVVRETQTGEKTYYRLDLRDKNIINNPGYYLHQNDIVYVEPNKTRKHETYSGQSTTFAISCVTIGASLLSLLARLL